MRTACPCFLGSICAVLIGIAGCSDTPSDASNSKPKGEASENERTAPLTTKELNQARQEIHKKRVAVDTLYLTTEGREVIAPGNRQGVIVDNGELAWAAHQCENPNCPGREADGKPLLFPWPDHLIYIKDDGTVGMKQPSTDEEFRQDDEFGEQKCPACVKNRNIEAESEDERRQYQSWCRLHVLPSAAKRLKELAEERKRLNKRKKKP